MNRFTYLEQVLIVLLTEMFGSGWSYFTKSAVDLVDSLVLAVGMNLVWLSQEKNNTRDLASKVHPRGKEVVESAESKRRISL